jgi:hypothetical protein
LLLKNTRLLAEVIVIEQPRPITKELIESLRLPRRGNEDLSSISVFKMLNGHTVDCASQGEGPCTCGTQEELEAIAREEAGED